MTSANCKLSLLTFPQRWDGTTGALTLRVAVLPRMNPLEPLLDRLPPQQNEPPFASAKLSLQAMLIPSLERLPDPVDVTRAEPFGANVFVQREALYQAVAGTFPLAPPGAVLPKPEPRRKDTYIKKFLPLSYRHSFAFERPSTPFAYTDKTYECALRTPPTEPTKSTPLPGMSWGQVIAAALQQPRLAEHLGLIQAATITLPSVDFFEYGGWIYVALAPESDYASLAPPATDHIKYYAARLPSLRRNEQRPVFAAVMFPVLSGPPPATYDENFSEAEVYDDGLGKIVHAEQPRRADFLDDSEDSLVPVQDAGIQLGWDDEQLTIWMNRQIDPAFEAQDSPMSVLGYRVDVRESGEPEWTSLARVQGRLKLASVLNETYKGEHSLRIAPIQLHGQRTGDFWLPAYFARWIGKSLVARDDFGGKLFNDPGDAGASVWKPVGLDRIALRYGKSYEFRVRLCDITGGGPLVTDPDIVNPGPAPIGRCDFRRHLPPRHARVEASSGSSTCYLVRRPVLGYPALVFTGFLNAEQALVADVPDAQAETRDVGVPDPDVETVEIAVEVRDPAMIELSGYRTLYVASRAFPIDPQAPLLLELDFQDRKNVNSAWAPGDQGPLPVPTSRDVRLRLTPVCWGPDTALEYFGSQQARRGMASHISARADSFDERDLLVTDTESRRIRAILLRPDSQPTPHQSAARAFTGTQQEATADLAQRLAQQLGLNVDGLTYGGRPGRRIVFGSTPRLRHVLGGDNASITFSSRGDLGGQWLCVLTLQIDRDWTWDALADVSFEVHREVTDTRSGAVERDLAGTIEVRRTVSFTARRDSHSTQTDMIFFDSIDTKPDIGEFPGELDVRYRVTARFKGSPTADDPLELNIRLPVAAPPTQTPRLASAGIALSPYVRTSDYSSTFPRQKMLWFEFEEPILDERDAYFARVLAYAPDPMLSSVTPAEPPLPEESPLSVDPELTRVITPGQSDDRAGIDAMQRLLPSASPRHFLIPLPEYLSDASSELFGFFVYELRAGHAKGWCTAQGRFGPALRVTGVQHPAPALTCHVSRRMTLISATAPYAAAVLDGRNLQSAPPSSEIWGLLYAQVTQIDGADQRNVLLSRRRAVAARRHDLQEMAERLATAHWDQSELEQLLAGLALPKNSPLSVLAVEVLPAFGRMPDPLGGDLGHVRILRTSPLMPVPAICT